MTYRTSSPREHWLRQLQLFREVNILSDSGIFATNVNIHLLHGDSVEARKGWDYNGSDPDYLVLSKTPPRKSSSEEKGFWASLGDVLKETAEAQSAPRMKIPWDEIEDIVRARNYRE